MELLIDTHAHLTMGQFDEDREQVIERARAAGIEYIVEIGTDLEGSRSALALAENHPGLLVSLGIHPHEAVDVTGEALDEIKALAANPKVVGIGEAGLDYHYMHSPKEVQIDAFKAFIQLAKELHLPLILHIREAHDDTLAILENEAPFKNGGVAHCFSGGTVEAKRYLALGFHLSFTGIATFPKAEETREVIRKTPMERILIETDSPYLAPVPKRGKRNEPANVRYISEKIAEVKGLSTEDVARITTLNAKKLFGIRETPVTRIAYPIRDSLYLNITNRCTNTCTFCTKFRDYTVKGHYLKLENEPTKEEVLKAIGGASEYREVVFCGFGEPLLRPSLIKEVAAVLKAKGVRVRIDTDGLANLVHERNIVEELKGLVDVVSVSLNAPDAETYAKYCKSSYGTDAYAAVKAFIKEAARHIPRVIATAVALPGLDIEACRKVAEDELGVPFRVREYNEVG